MSVHLEYRERERQRKKRTKGDRLVKFNEKKSKSDREKTKETFFVGGTT